MKKIYINPGHGDSDPGAVGYETERQLNVAVSRFMGDYLQANYQCEIKMNPGAMESLTDICKEANGWGADLFVSNHFNAGGGDGYEALVYGQSRVALGRIFEKHILAIGQNSRGVKLRPGLTVLKNTNMPAIVNEGAFVDNLKDISQWNDTRELQLLGEAYGKAAAEFLGLEKRESDTLADFVRELQAATGSKVDGIAGPETLGNTPTLSANKNATHPAVAIVQKWLFYLGYTQVGEADGVAGPKFTAGVKAYQTDHDCVPDGEITAGHKTWRKLLGME